MNYLDPLQSGCRPKTALVAFVDDLYQELDGRVCHSWFPWTFWWLSIIINHDSLLGCLAGMRLGGLVVVQILHGRVNSEGSPGVFLFNGLSFGLWHPLLSPMKLV